MANLLAHVPLLRTILYAGFLLSSLLTLSLSAALIPVGMNIAGYDYRPSAVLLVASLLSLAIVTPLHLVFHCRPSTHVLSTTWVELVVLGILNLLFLGGAAAMANQVRVLSYCSDYNLCGVDDALQAFAWLAWISSLLLLTLVVVTALMEKRSGIWREQFGVGRTREKATERLADEGDVQMVHRQPV